MTQIAEADLQRTIVEAARLYGWLVYHPRPARTTRGWRTPLTGNPGFPDLILVRKGRLLALELKSDKGRETPEQRLWIDELEGAVVTAAVARPADLDRILLALR